MESCDDIDKHFDYELPRSDMGEDPLKSFKEFYRMFPHFSKVEL